MTFYEKGNGEMGNDFLQNRIGEANAISAENIFVVFSFKLTPHPLKRQPKKNDIVCDIMVIIRFLSGNICYFLLVISKIRFATSKIIYFCELGKYSLPSQKIFATSAEIFLTSDKIFCYFRGYIRYIRGNISYLGKYSSICVTSGILTVTSEKYSLPQRNDLLSLR